MPRRNTGPALRFIERRGVYYIVWYDLGAERMRSTGTADLAEAEQALLDFRQDGVLPPVRVPREVEQFVYFVGAEDGPIKIGLAADPEARLRELQCGSPVKLSLLAIGKGGRSAEYLYHAQLHEHRLHGEWFDRHPAVLSEIERLNAGAGK